MRADFRCGSVILVTTFVTGTLYAYKYVEYGTISEALPFPLRYSCRDLLKRETTITMHFHSCTSVTSESLISDTSCTATAPTYYILASYNSWSRYWRPSAISLESLIDNLSMGEFISTEDWQACLVEHALTTQSTL